MGGAQRVVERRQVRDEAPLAPAGAGRNQPLLQVPLAASVRSACTCVSYSVRNVTSNFVVGDDVHLHDDRRQVARRQRPGREARLVLRSTCAAALASV